jgi:fructose-bisphosphate aldolase, class I
MSGKRIRLSHLVHPVSGNSVTIPLDHGIALGAIPGLTDPLAVLDQLVELGVDAVLLGPGLAKLSTGVFERRTAPARVLTVDYALFSSIPGRPSEVTETGLISSVDFALKYDFDCLKVVLVWGLERDKQLENLRLVGQIAEECDRTGLPLMVEPVLWGGLIAREEKNDAELIEHAARIALEVGADLLKIPYTGEPDSFSRTVKRLSVPVMVLGGPKMGTSRDLLRVASESIRAGARGIVFGRNVWQSSSMAALVRALQEVVHKGIDADAAMGEFEPH